MLRDVLIQRGLSNRESEVAELVTKGMSNKEVANQLFVTEKTVKFHLTNIYKKMNVKSRAQLIVWCLPHLGFVENEADAARTDAQSISTPNANIANTIPAGSATVGEASRQEIDIIPNIPNRGPEFGGNQGSGNMGSFS